MVSVNDEFAKNLTLNFSHHIDTCKTRAHTNSRQLSNLKRLHPIDLRMNKRDS